MQVKNRLIRPHENRPLAKEGNPRDDVLRRAIYKQRSMEANFDLGFNFRFGSSTNEEKEKVLEDKDKENTK